MDKETVEKKIKLEMELLKLYSVFIIALGASLGSLALKPDILQNKVAFFLLVSSLFIFLIFVIGFFQTFYKFKQLSKKLAS